MTISTRKINVFAKLITGLADHPSLGSTTLLKQWFDSSPEELRLALNGLIDDLTSTTVGSSGSENIGSAAISGVSGLTTYTQLLDLKNQLTSAVFGALTTETKSALMQKIGIINGNFDVWQRGVTQITSASGSYFPDRISIANFTGNISAIKIDQGSSLPPIGSKYYLRYRISTASAVSASVSRMFRYKMESIDTQKLIGNQITISFKIKTSIARNLQYSLNIFGFTSVDNGTNGTGLIVGDGDYAQNTIGLTANAWTTITKTFTMQDPSSGTGLASNGVSIELWGRYTTAGAETDTEYQISQIKLDIGSVALPFQPNNYGDVLKLCERYCYLITSANATGGFTKFSVGQAFSATQAVIVLQFPEMRTAPTVSTSAVANFTLSDSTFSANKVVSAITAGIRTSKNIELGVTCATGLGIGNATTLTANGNTSAYILLDSEL